MAILFLSPVAASRGADLQRQGEGQVRVNWRGSSLSIRRGRRIRLGWIWKVPVSRGIWVGYEEAGWVTFLCSDTDRTVRPDGWGGYEVSGCIWSTH